MKLFSIIGALLLSLDSEGQFVNGTFVNGTMRNAAFTPLSVPSLLFWNQPSTLSGSDNTKITTWTDSSGNGHDFKEKITGNDPVITNNVIGGLPALWFDGLVAQLTNTFGGLKAQPITIYMVCSQGISTNNSKVYDGVDLSNRIAASIATNGNTMSLFAGTTDNAGGATVRDKFYCWSWVFNGASSVIRSNGVVYLSPTTSGSQGANGLTMMMRPDNTRPCRGYVSEMIGYTANHTATSSLTNIENYLRAKYGL